MRPKIISIIIPVYNEEKYIDKMIEAVCAANTFSYKKEIVIINDGSNDQTKSKITKKVNRLHHKYKITVINRKKNRGKGAAVRAGFASSTGDIVIIQDADLEYNPEDYPLMMEPFIKFKADVVYGSRFISSRPHRVLYFWHYVGNLIITHLSNILTNLNLTDIETGYKAFRGELIRQIAPKIKSSDFGFEPEITAKISKLTSLKLFEVGISYWGRTYNQGKKIGWVDGIKAVYYVLKYNLFA